MLPNEISGEMAEINVEALMSAIREKSGVGSAREARPSRTPAEPPPACASKSGAAPAKVDAPLRTRDFRHLGVCVRAVRLLGDGDDDGVTLGAEAVAGVEESGFYPPEFVGGRPVRWTDGAAKLAVKVGNRTPTTLRVELDSTSPEGSTLCVVANGVELCGQSIASGDWSGTFDLSGVVVGDLLRIELLSSTFIPGDTSVFKRQADFNSRVAESLKAMAGCVSDVFGEMARLEELLREKVEQSLVATRQLTERMEHLMAAVEKNSAEIASVQAGVSALQERVEGEFEVARRAAEEARAVAAHKRQSESQATERSIRRLDERIGRATLRLDRFHRSAAQIHLQCESLEARMCEGLGELRSWAGHCLDELHRDVEASVAKSRLLRSETETRMRRITEGVDQVNRKIDAMTERAPGNREKPATRFKDIYVTRREPVPFIPAPGDKGATSLASEMRVSTENYYGAHQLEEVDVSVSQAHVAL